MSPTNGTTDTTYTYYVTYHDPTGANPAFPMVVIDNTAFEMQLYNGTGSNGVYNYSINLDSNSHVYYFMFTTATGQIIAFRWPGEFSGPTVTAPTPIPTDTPTSQPTAAPQTSHTSTPAPRTSPTPAPTATPTPKPTPNPTPEATIVITTPTATINTVAAYQSSNYYPVWAIAAVVIVAVTLGVTLKMKQQQTTEPSDEF